MFQAAKVNGSRYCGLVSLSAVTGLGTKEIAQTVRYYFPFMKRVRGMSGMALGTVMQHFGVKNRYENCSGTLKNWVENHLRPNTVYIVLVTSHALVVYNDKVVCTQFHGKVGLLSESIHLRRKVKGVYTIESDPKKEIKIPAAPSNWKITLSTYMVKVAKKIQAFVKRFRRPLKRR